MHVLNGKKIGVGKKKLRIFWRKNYPVKNSVVVLCKFILKYVTFKHLSYSTREQEKKIETGKNNFVKGIYQEKKLPLCHDFSLKSTSTYISWISRKRNEKKIQFFLTCTGLLFKMSPSKFQFTQIFLFPIPHVSKKTRKYSIWDEVIFFMRAHAVTCARHPWKKKLGKFLTSDLYKKCKICT